MQEMTEQEYQRILRLPAMLENARRKVRMLEREAERRGMRELLPEKLA